MTDAQYVFRQDSREKKNIARQAQYRKRGSKSKKCSLPSDGMTQKQWEEACGPVQTFKLNDPVSWEEFKSWPPHIRETYVSRLHTKYAAGAPQFAELFGISVSGFRHFCSNNNIVVPSKGKGFTLNAEQRAKWEP